MMSRCGGIPTDYVMPDLIRASTRLRSRFRHPVDARIKSGMTISGCKGLF
jgi:hypothetical protein